ncbi:MAG: PDZ domain-containing protein, partial [Ignavibacteriales bacterium]
IAGLKIVSEITAEEADYYNLPVKQGVTITPMKNSPAAKAGLRNYDIIQTVNGHKVTSGYDLQDCMFGCKVGDEVTVEVVRIPRRAGEAVRQFKYRIKLDGDGAK